MSGRLDPAGMVAAVAEAHGLGGSFAPLESTGVTNHVYATDEVVVRFARDPLRGTVSDVGEFVKEAWCAEAARGVGVPTPGVVAVGEVDGVPHIVHERARGHHPDPASPELWQRLGEYATRLATIDLDSAPEHLFSRFGRDLPSAWQQHVTYNRAALAPGDALRGLGVYGADDTGWLDEQFATLAEVELVHGLCHGDLNPGNVLVADDGELVLLDWGSAAAGPVPWADLMHLQEGHFRHAAGDFAAPFGVEGDDLDQTLARMRLLQAVDLVRWSLDRRADLLEHYVSRATATVNAARPAGRRSAAR
ncbi:phosphotransferase family protein [Aestuariimicrobium ganziense]|uniref:phosphotransferase family protein n=1 Tax=Aestuariimicrobium ganziense TaxID=2773677 RepID=UPI001942AE7F|nr:phosphotransferase [Aestuariimicrobium ganziense]